MHAVGKRRVDGDALSDQRRLAHTVALLRGTRHLVPRGVVRFSDFDEAEAWWTRSLIGTHARRRMLRDRER